MKNKIRKLLTIGEKRENILRDGGNHARECRNKQQHDNESDRE